MITRAQAEALLTLAESLEACERLGLRFIVDYGGDLDLWEVGPEGRLISIIGSANGMDIRLAVNALIPKQEN